MRRTSPPEGGFLHGRVTDGTGGPPDDGAPMAALGNAGRTPPRTVAARLNGRVLRRDEVLRTAASPEAGRS